MTQLPKTIGIIGVGYVGLPLAVYFAKEFEVIAFDVSSKRINELKSGFDRTKEVEGAELDQKSLSFTDDPKDLEKAEFHIVTVPTPVNEFKSPDLNPLLLACEILAPVLKNGQTIVFESTVYPGLTEEVLAPKLEKLSGLKFNKDFFLAYSPERINPGDKEHTLPKIKKVVSGSTPETLELVAQVYGRIISAGIFKAKSIATAEAAKVIENVQRDVNVGLINELALLFDRMGLDIYDVLEASATKWNFLKFKPGLVGGHCIGVDPYYLTHKAQQVGFNPAMILAGRRINDSMAEFFASKVLRGLVKRKLTPVGARIAILGFTFKENCPDTRNTKVIDLVKKLREDGMEVDIIDPVADSDSARHEYSVDVFRKLPTDQTYSAAVLAVSHTELLEQIKKGEIEKRLAPNGFILDIKGVLTPSSQVIR